MSRRSRIIEERETDKSFKILYGCGGCKHKTQFVNTKRFRVNANGNRLDVWLIYQCVKCKHTKNLTIYERRKTSKILPEEYERFLANDEELAEEYGQDKDFFARNKVEVIKGKR